MDNTIKSIVEWGFDSTNQRWYINCIEVTYDGEEETSRKILKQRYSKDVDSGSINGYTSLEPVAANSSVWNEHWNYNEAGARLYCQQFTHMDPASVTRKDIE